MGIKISKFGLGKSLEDYKVTLERIAMAAKWDKETILVWERKGWSVCRSLIGEAHAAPRKAQERETAETRLRNGG